MRTAWGSGDVSFESRDGHECRLGFILHMMFQERQIFLRIISKSGPWRLNSLRFGGYPVVDPTAESRGEKTLTFGYLVSQRRSR